MDILQMSVNSDASSPTRGPGWQQSQKLSRHMQGSRQVLLNAISEDEFYVVYQPQTDITGTSVCGVEALLRWNSARFGHVSPCEFIPLAENVNLISEIGKIVIQKSCEQLSRWKDEHDCQLRLAINVSCMQMHQHSIIDTFEHYIRLYKLKPADLEVELTESTLVRDKDKVINVLHEIRQMGMRTAIDDFGTGYSSLSHLASMPFDLLKIDKSFIHKLGLDSAHTTITQSIIQMARCLNMEVLAEGVETVQQQQILQESMCDMIQGNLISMPVAADKIPSITGMYVS